MRHLFFIIILSLFSFAIGNAQDVVPVYKKLRIDLSTKTIGDLARLGVEVEHGYNREDQTLTNVYTEDEVNQIRKAGFKFQILSEDVMQDYIKESAKAVPYDYKLEDRSDACGHSILSSKVPNNFHYGSMGYYLTYTEILQELDLMKQKYPNLISEKAYNPSFKTKRGNYIYYVKISDNPNTDESQSENQALFTALHHSREPISMMQMVYFMWYVLENYNTNPEIKYLVDKSELFFIPCVNPDGYIYNETLSPEGGGLWRKNRNYDFENPDGVDLNRNYGMAWDYDDVGSSPIPTSDTYRGSDPFSEQETKAVRSLVKSNNFRMVMNYHSYANEIIYPWGFNSANTQDSLTYITYANYLSADNDYGYGLNVEVLDYQVNGTSDDWIYTQGSTETPLISMTTECGKAEQNETNSFWPLVNRIIPICDELLPQNIKILWLINGKVESRLSSENIIKPGFDTLRFNVKRMGLQADPVIIHVKPIGNDVSPFDRTINFSGEHLQSLNFDVPVFVINNKVKYTKFQIITIYSGYTEYDTIELRVAPYKELFTSDGNDLSQFKSQSSDLNWVVTNKAAYNDNSSFALTWNDTYSKAMTKELITKFPIQLPVDDEVYLSFFAQWFIEKNSDLLKVYVSEDGNYWNPICGNATRPGSLDQVKGEPVLDGYHPYWQNVIMDLSEYAGKSVYFKFYFRSDARWNKTGIFIDKIRVLSLESALANNVEPSFEQDVYPNPARNVIFIKGSFPSDATFILYSADGREVTRQSNIYSGQQIDLKQLNISAGLYLYKIRDSAGHETSGKLIVQ